MTKYGYTYNGFADSGDNSENGSRSSGYSYSLDDAPPLSPEESERVEKIVEKVVEKHGDVLEKLGNE